jgi:hypothetical protein
MEKYSFKLMKTVAFAICLFTIVSNTFAKENKYRYVTLEYISKPKTLEMFSHISSVQNNVVHTNIELN